MNMRTRSTFEVALFAVLFVFGLFYVGNTWSPSSYGIFLQQHDPENAGVVWGKPRAIRSDEWAVVTPLTQATVNNNFERYNKTSFYNEDLRINYGLPIYDWGMVFKPTMWGYLFLKPGMAYSLNWYLVFAIFIVGYFKLFNVIGLSRILSLSASITLYFSTFSQFWWDEKGPVIAFFPWIAYILIAKLKPIPTLLAFYWLSASWLITDFYPPTVISLGFVGAILFLCYGSHWFDFRKLAGLAVAAIAAIATTLFYLKDYLLKTSQTLYPGHRSIGGGSLSWSEWISQLLPFSTFNKNFDVFTTTNISEIGAVGVPIILMILTHVNYRNPLAVSYSKKEKANIYIILFALILMNLWMLAPAPAELGKLLLWDNVHPVRMKYAAGLMLTIFALLVSSNLNYVVNIKRFLIYKLVIIFGWYLTKLSYAHVKIDNELFDHIHDLSRDLYFIPGMALAYLAIKYLKFKPIQAFGFCSALVSLIVVSPFNPIQSSDAIFASHDVIKEKIDPYVDQSSGVLAIPGYPGAILNGLGYKSVTHVTAVPAMSVWKNLFPKMNENDFQRVFNRYSHIHLANISQPDSPQPDVVEIPLSEFGTRVYLPTVNDNKLLPLHQGDILKGKINGLAAGILSGFSPLIGNYNNTSKGILTVKVCNANICQHAEIDLGKTVDNAYAPLFFKQPLVIHAESITTYEFELKNSLGSLLALWSSKTNSTNTMVANNATTKLNLMPNLEVNYAK